jgi:hypothetical protein
LRFQGFEVLSNQGFNEVSRNKGFRVKTFQKFLEIKLLMRFQGFMFVTFQVFEFQGSVFEVSRNHVFKFQFEFSRYLGIKV